VDSAFTALVVLLASIVGVRIVWDLVVKFIGSA
jgi:hypothetical protein